MGPEKLRELKDVIKSSIETWRGGKAKIAGSWGRTVKNANPGSSPNQKKCVGGNWHDKPLRSAIHSTTKKNYQEKKKGEKAPNVLPDRGLPAMPARKSTKKGNGSKGGFKNHFVGVRRYSRTGAVGSSGGVRLTIGYSFLAKL